MICSKNDTNLYIVNSTNRLQINMKPILIDALRINMGGGLSLLNYLVSSLLNRNVDFILLKDYRCPRLDDEVKLKKMRIMSPDDKTRKEFYKKHGEEFHSVLCFGNVPPPMRINSKVFTYFHNVSLLKIPRDYPLKWKLSSLAKKFYIRHFVNNTDVWIVQTSNTANLLNKEIVKNRQPIEILPFYKLDENLRNWKPEKKTDYVFIGECTNAKGHKYLLEAWEKLHKMGIDRTLHFTVTDENFSKEIEIAKSKGVIVINHGHIPFDEVIELYHKSKATVYPSLNESLGLGIIEAMEAGCDVIGCDLPYIHSICNPSEVFEPKSPVSIVQSIVNYEKGNSPKSELKIYDMIDVLIYKLLEKT